MLLSSGRNGGRQARRACPSSTEKIEYEIRYATTDAAKGWQDLAATIRNPLADAWDFLTRTPTAPKG